MSRTTSLPVLMYHYISRHEDSISVSPDLFAGHCEKLAKAGWHGVSMAEAEAYFLHGEDLPPKSCLITFDDGYLDNYVHAWPILRRYGHKAVIFAVSGRMEEGETCRPTLADVWSGALAANDLPRVDAPFIRHANGYEIRDDLFCNWAEARAMEESGVMAVASHTYGHRGVCVNDDYKGFFLPERKGRTFHDPENVFPGMPKFVMGPGLMERAFVMDPELAAKIKALVPQNERDAFAFSQNRDAMRSLEDLAASYAGRLGRMETDEEMANRMRAEIMKGKSVLEQGLGHPVASLCWPWGAYNQLSLSLAREAGFSVFFTTRQGPNPPGSPLAVHRFKAKANPPSWLLNRVRVYASSLLAALYAKIQMRTPGKNKGKRKSFVVRNQ